jgi:hypothetical protein
VGDEEADSVTFQPPGGEDLCAKRRAVDPLDVVDDDEDRVKLATDVGGWAPEGLLDS